MKDGLYNIATEWSIDVINAVKHCRDIPYHVIPTYHFTQKCIELDLKPSVACVALKGRIVEVEIQSGKVVKLITRIRHRYKKGVDMVFAVGINSINQVATVKTVWLNNVNDNHYTLKFENLC